MFFCFHFFIYNFFDFQKTFLFFEEKAKVTKLNQNENVFYCLGNKTKIKQNQKQKKGKNVIKQILVFFKLLTYYRNKTSFENVDKLKIFVKFLI